MRQFSFLTPDRSLTAAPRQELLDQDQTDRLHHALTRLLERPVALVITDNRHSIITIKRGPSGFAIRLHRIFLEATEAVLSALARWAAGPRRRVNRTVQAFIDQNQSRIHRPLKSRKPRKIRLCPRGSCFDLARTLQRLQQDYFAVDLGLQITWGSVRKKPGRRQVRLGSYSAANKLIRINPLLDRDFVPAYVIDDIVFHEILHHHVGHQTQNGRNLVHHHTFKKSSRIIRRPRPGSRKTCRACCGKEPCNRQTEGIFKRFIQPLSIICCR